jgi:hypothetical protein
VRAKLIAATAAFGILLAACSGGSGDDKASGGSKSDSAAATVTCEPREDEKPARAILRCGEPSIAFVQTLYATGTGVAVAVGDKHYILTNQHVVDPFDAADIVIGKHEVKHVPLVGADVAADIALLGPIKADVPTLAIGDTKHVERGDDVYLVGYPGESVGDDHEATIASGIVARTREAKEWSQRYVQTDATIAGGQSGGPLFDADGRLIGISGLSYADQFALALSGEDVQEAVGHIVNGEGDDILRTPAALPAKGGATQGVVKLADAAEFQSLFLPVSDTARTWHLDVAGADSNISVVVTDTETSEPIAVNAASVAQEQHLVARLQAAGVATDDITGANSVTSIINDAVRARETSPGHFTIDVAAGKGADVSVNATNTDAPVDVSWTSDQALWPASLPVTTKALALGDTAKGVLNAYDTAYAYTVDLDAGQQVEVWARSPQGDMEVDVVPPNVTYDAVTAYDPEHAGVQLYSDSEEGLFGLDVRENFTAKVAGTYRFNVYDADATTTAFRFSVSRAAH